jgi:peroxiredoxin
VFKVTYLPQYNGQVFSKYCTPEETNFNVMSAHAQLLGISPEATSRKRINKKELKINSNLLYSETIQYILYN